MRVRYAIGITMLSALVAGVAVSEEKPMELLGSVDGICAAIAPGDDSVYVGRGMSLVTYRLDGCEDAGKESASGPERLDSLIMYGVVTGIVAQGGMVYVAAGSGGLRVVDATAPNDLKLIEVWETSREVTAVAMNSHLLAAAWRAKVSESEWSGGVSFYGFDGDDSLNYQGEYAIEDSATAVAFHEDLVYLGFDTTGSFGGMLVLNAGNPSAPQMIGETDVFLTPLKMQMHENYMYIRTEASAIAICNMDIPEAPSYVGLVSSAADDFIIAGDWLYAEYGDWGEVMSMDLSDPENPVAANTFYLPDRICSMGMQDETLWIGGQGGSLAVVSAPGAGALESLCISEWTGSVLDMAVKGDRAYLLHSPFFYNALKTASTLYTPLCTVDIYDIATPEEPTKIGTIALPEVDAHTTDYSYISAASIAVFGDLLALTVGNFDYSPPPSGSFYLYNVSHPDAPQLLSSSEQQDDLYVDVAVVDDWAYLSIFGFSEKYLQVANLADPASPEILPETFISGDLGPPYLATEDHLIYMAINNIFMEDILALVIDVSTPDLPRQIGRYRLEPGRWGTLDGQAVQDGIAYLALGEYWPDSGVLAIDWRRPSAPQELGWYGLSDINDRIRDIDVQSDRLYLATRFGVERVDISDPAAPLFTDRYPLYGSPWKIQARDGLIYVADQTLGFYILTGHRFPLEIAVQGAGTTDPAPGESMQQDDTPVTITATPDPGWRFLRWEGPTLDDPTANPLSLYVTAKTQLTAVFEEIQYALTLAAEGQGYTNPAPGAYTYLHDTEVSVAAIALDGWAFDHWEGDFSGESTGNPQSVILDGDKSLTAVFAPLMSTLSIATEGEGSTSPAPGSHTYATGSTLQALAMPATGWQFDHWAFSTQEISHENPLSLTLDADVTLTAVFEPLEVSLTIEIEGEGSTTPTAGIHTYTYGAEVSIAAEAAQGWRFDHWEAGLKKAIIENPVVLTLERDRSLTAVFTQIEYTLTIGNTGQGSTAPAIGSTSYAEGAEVEITATPAEGWIFDHWAGDCGDTPNANPLTLVMDANRSVTAVFVQLQYTLTIAVEGNGQASLPAGQHTYPAGSAVILAALPDADWEFDHWEGDAGADSYANPLTIAVDADKSLTAVFRAVEKPFWSCGGAPGESPAFPSISDAFVIGLLSAVLFMCRNAQRKRGSF